MFSSIVKVPEAVTGATEGKESEISVLSDSVERPHVAMAKSGGARPPSADGGGGGGGGGGHDGAAGVKGELSSSSSWPKLPTSDAAAAAADANMQSETEAGAGAEAESACDADAAASFPPSYANAVSAHRHEETNGCAWSPSDASFGLVPGELVTRVGCTAATGGKLVLTNFRLHHSSPSDSDALLNIPLGLIEYVEVREGHMMHLFCKNGKLYQVLMKEADAVDSAEEWLRRINEAIVFPKKLGTAFAFLHYSAASRSRNSCTLARQPNGSVDANGGTGDESDTASDATSGGMGVLVDEASPLYSTTTWFASEVTRLRFDLRVAWRVSRINRGHKMCPSYPEEILVPHSVSDADLTKVAKFRGSRRIPSVIFRHVKTGAVLARCSQPEVGWLGWREQEDEKLVRAISDACAYDRGAGEVNSSSVPVPSRNSSYSGEGEDESENNSINGSENIKDLSVEADRIGSSVPKVLIVDARSYAAAVGNRARGGGVECEEYYPNTEIVFMNLANIHGVRKSFQALRTLLNTPPTEQSLDSSKWLTHISSLLKASVRVVQALDEEGRPVIVHCSDGWDRTPQIVSIAQMLLDPYYRTIDGFQTLIEKDWLDYGHKMADRCGNPMATADVNERSPIFLQWLDCVHQLLRQFPCHFEFNASFLVKLATHVYSQLYGTFLGNSQLERQNAKVKETTISVFDFLKSHPEKFRNYLHTREDLVLRPKCELSTLLVWREVYLSAKLQIKVPSGAPDLSNGIHSLQQQPRAFAAAAAADSASSSVSTSSTPTSECEESESPSCTPPTATVLKGPASCDQRQAVSEGMLGTAADSLEKSGVAGQLLRGALESTIESSTDTLVPEAEADEEEKHSAASPHIQPKVVMGEGEATTAGNRSENAAMVNGHNAPAAVNGIENASGKTRQEEIKQVGTSNPYDSDGLLTIDDPVQDTLYNLIKAHKEEVSALRRELCLTSPASADVNLNGDSAGCDFPHRSGRIVSAGDAKGSDNLGEDSVCGGVGGATNPINVTGSGSKAVRSVELASSWEKVDMKPSLWGQPPPDMDALNCQRCQTPIWAGKRKYTCPQCARFFCRECSDGFFRLSNGADQVEKRSASSPLRVCDACFTEMNSGRDEKRSSSSAAAGRRHEDGSDTDELQIYCDEEAIEVKEGDQHQP